MKLVVPSWLTLSWFPDMVAVVSELLVRGVSINLYMFHGGTSFGFMSGAMDFGTYKPQVTSYGGSRAHRGCLMSLISMIRFL